MPRWPSHCHRTMYSVTPHCHSSKEEENYQQRINPRHIQIVPGGGIAPDGTKPCPSRLSFLRGIDSCSDHSRCDFCPGTRKTKFNKTSNNPSFRSLPLQLEEKLRQLLLPKPRLDICKFSSLPEVFPAHKIPVGDAFTLEATACDDTPRGTRTSDNSVREVTKLYEKQPCFQE